MNKIIFSILVAGAFILLSLPAQASLTQMKAYKEAFPDAKVKCIDCHTDEHPKKDDGQHEVNDYGKAVVKAAGSQKPTADNYKSVGTVEDFAKKAGK